LYYYYIKAFDGTNLSLKSNTASSYPSNKSNDVNIEVVDNQIPRVAVFNTCESKLDLNNFFNKTGNNYGFYVVNERRPEHFCSDKGFNLTTYAKSSSEYSLSSLFSSSLEIISIHPNPADDEVNITISNPLYSTITIDIYDITGRKVMSNDMGELIEGEHSLNLDTSSLSSGVYTVYIETTSGSFSSKKFVKVN